MRNIRPIERILDALRDVEWTAADHLLQLKCDVGGPVAVLAAASRFESDSSGWFRKLRGLERLVQRTLQVVSNHRARLIGSCQPIQRVTKLSVPFPTKRAGNYAE